MNEKFTGSKWEFNPDTGNIKQHGADTNFARVYFPLSGREEYEANMRLIVKAPEMYYMLYNMLFEFKHNSHLSQKYMFQVISDIEKILREINPEVFNTHLKPCPFCGGEATLVYPEHEGIDDYIIGCYDGGCGFSYERARGKNKQEVIKAWNMRACENA